jgi:hypothetical protein
MRPIHPVAFVLFAAMTAAALTPATESTLKGLGLDTQSSIIRAIAADSVTAESGEVYTLDSLAAKGDLTAVKSFLVTREFFHDFREDPDVVFPNDELYNILYLAELERVYMARKLMEGLPQSANTAPAANENTSALKLATASFLKELGMDPKSSRTLAIASDSVTAKSGKVHTLDSLAAKRDETGVKAFIATRAFIRDFKRDSTVDFPDDELYNIAYLTAPEKVYIATKLKESFPKPDAKD